MMNRNQKSAQTAVRTRRLMLKPSSQGEGDFGLNVLPIGTHLGEFEIKGLIGEGGFGIVYLAYDHSLERQVALKEYMPSGLATRTTKMAVSVRSQSKIDTFTAGLKSFINEARMLAQFDSPALVKVHSFWEGNGTAYMVMPYYEGMTLKQALQTRHIKPTEGWIRMLLTDLCDAIDILHRAHCLHRDIAPDNILLLKDGRPLLLDFGAARRVIGDLTQCFTAILKPGFAPIEQYADIAGLRQGAWTDIYALAAVVYYLITGKAPPPSVARMVHDELVPAREAGKGRYSEAFLATIDKALGVRPEQRFHSIEELRQALGIVEPEPRTVPYPGTDWSTTVARTAPLAAPAEGKGNASPASPPAPSATDADITRHAGPPVRPADDITAIAAPVRQPDSAPAVGARVAPQPGNAARPANAAQSDSDALKGAQKDGPANARQGKQAEKPVPPPVKPLSEKASRPASAPQAKAPGRVEPELLSVTQMAGDWHHPQNSQNPQNPKVPPHLHEQDTTFPRRRDGKGWLVLALLFAAGIGSGIYLGTNHSWDGLSEQAIDSDSGGSEPLAGGTPQSPSAQSSTQPSEQSSAQSIPPASPPTADASAGTASSGASDSSSAAAGAPGVLGTPEQPAAASSQQRSEIDMWKMASKRNQASEYEDYLREYPQGRYAAIAKLRLERLQAAATPRPASPPDTAISETRKPESAAASPRIKPEEAAWSKATTINSAAAYQEYLRKYPRGGYAALARDRLASLKPAATAPEPPVALAPSPATPSATPPSASTLAQGEEAATPQRQARQDAQPGARKDEDSVAAATPPAPTTVPAAVPTSAATTSAASAPSASSSTALTPSTSTSASASMAPASPPQASTAPASGAKEASSPTASISAAEPPAQSATQSAGSDGGKSAAASIPPQASLKPQDATPSAGSAADTAGRIIKFADQTMTGNFSVDKKSGLVSGKGKVSWSNGNQFEGTLVQGSKEGKGKFTWNSGQRYNGDWAHDVPNGRGVFNFPDGSRYEGDVKNGLPHGQGTTRFKNGIVYTGDWVRGKSHGHGRYIWTDGSYWEGEFRDDRKTENGRMHFPNKDKGNAVGTAPAPAENTFQRATTAATDRQTEEK